MSIVFDTKYIENTLIDDPIIKEIYLVVSHIKSSNFPQAYQILTQHNLSFGNITSKTQTLKDIELVKFMDFVAKQKGVM